MIICVTLFPVAQIGQQDPYCKLYCGAGGLVVKTKVDEDAGTSADWHQSFHFDVSSLPDSDFLFFEVKDKNVMVNTSIGCGKVALNSVSLSAPHDAWHPIFDDSGRGAGQ
eukprot:1224-Heterococcus_DN1.PRE.3